MEQFSLTAPAAVRTKTVATVGPSCSDPQILARMIAKGADVFRINMAHGDRQQHEQVVRDIRQVSAETGKLVGILVDLAGPKLRLGMLGEDPTDCPLDDEFSFIRAEQPANAKELTSNYPLLVDELSVGNRVMLADGTVEMRVVDKHADHVRCRVIEQGIIRSRQGINLPDVALSVAALTDADRDNATWAAQCGVDFVGLSFVRSADDIHQLRQLLHSCDSRALIVAKIEKREALDRLDEITEASDAIMVARGDLGVEIDVAETPMAQKRVIAASRHWGRPVIVATQMLDSMQRSRRPTRAEATDVANAIIDGADACMLSGETAIGQFPVAAVEMMNRIMAVTEKSIYEGAAPSTTAPVPPTIEPVTAAMISGASHVASLLGARLIVVASRSGATSLVKSKHRGWIPTIGVSSQPTTLNQMCLFWGITPLPNAPLENERELFQFITRRGSQEGWVTPGDRIVFVTGTEMAHNTITVHEVPEPRATD